MSFRLCLIVYQESYDALEAKYKAERIILELKYSALRQPLCEQRRDVVSGAVDVEIEDEGEGAGAAGRSGRVLYLVTLLTLYCVQILL